MNFLKKTLAGILISASALASGCGRSYMELTINSEPPGANIYERGRFIGVTPASFTYLTELTTGHKTDVKIQPLTIVRQGYHPTILENSYPTPEKRSYHYSELVILQRNPSDPLPSQQIIIRGQQQTGVQKMMDGVDLGLKLNEMGRQIRVMRGP